MPGAEQLSVRKEAVWTVRPAVPPGSERRETQAAGISHERKQGPF